MTGNSLKDQTLIKLKDVALIIVTIGSLLFAAFKVYSKPYENEKDLLEFRKEHMARQERSEESLGNHEHRITVLETHYGNIMVSLGKIDRKLDRINGHN